MPRSLDLARLRQFEPAASQRDPLPPSDSAGAEVGPSGVPASYELERWPSREPVRDGQISIKAPLEVIERFRHLCRDDRRTYADMLSILMDAYERRG